MPLPQLETTRYAVDRGIATITLDRPDKLNAYNPRMRIELAALLDETDADDAVRVVVVTGAGRAFCAGADLSSGGDTFDRNAHPEDPLRESLRVGDVHRDGGGTTTLRMYRSLKPIIGAIIGAAVGVGVTMQLPMDIRMDRAHEAARQRLVGAEHAPGETPLERGLHADQPRQVPRRRGLGRDAAAGRHADRARVVSHRARVRRRRGAGARPRALGARAR